MPSHFIRYRNTTPLYLALVGVEVFILTLTYALELPEPAVFLLATVPNILLALAVELTNQNHRNCSPCLGRGAASAIFLFAFIATLPNYAPLVNMGVNERVWLCGSIVFAGLLLIPLRAVPFIYLCERHSKIKGVRPATSLWPFLFAISYAVISAYSWNLPSPVLRWLLGAQILITILCICDIGMLSDKKPKKSSKKK